MMGKIINFSHRVVGHLSESFRELSVRCLCSFIDLIVYGFRCWVF